MTEITFGDNVRVVNAPETAGAGVAGMLGQVYGVTTPSVTGIQPIGRPSFDVAYNVYFSDTGKDVWLGPHLIEIVDHAQGTMASLDGVENRWVRTTSGKWVDEADDTEHASLFKAFSRR